MVERRYMVEQARPPSAAIRFVNQRLLPGAIEAAATVETGFAGAATAARRWPLSALAVALGLGCLAGLRLWRAPR